jgi:hypothetical protein
MFDLGVRLQLLVGPTVPLPASYDVVDALRSVEVTSSIGGRDGFQLDFALGKDTLLDYSLLLAGTLDPPSRVVIIAIINGVPQVLMDGIITDHQIVPSNRPGDTLLRVIGTDLTVMMDLEQKIVTYPNQPDFVIATRLIASYAQLGCIPMVTPTADIPIELMRIPTQRGTDLTFLNQLAKRNGYVFYIEPTPVPLVNKAYFGPELRVGLPQPALTLNMAGQTNVDQPMHFRYDSLGPTKPEVTIVEGMTGLAITLPLPSAGIPLTLRPAKALRKSLSSDAAKLNPAQAAARGLADATESADAVEVTGEVDAVRYGSALRARQLVGVRGVGATYGGMLLGQAGDPPHSPRRLQAELHPGP